MRRTGDPDVEGTKMLRRLQVWWARFTGELAGMGEIEFDTDDDTPDGRVAATGRDRSG